MQEDAEKEGITGVRGDGALTMARSAPWQRHVYNRRGGEELSGCAASPFPSAPQRSPA